MGVQQAKNMEQKDMDCDRFAPIECEAKIFYTEGPAFAANLRRRISEAHILSCPAKIIMDFEDPMDEGKQDVGFSYQTIPGIALECCMEEEMKMYPGAMGMLANRIVSSDFLDSSKNEKYMPFADFGIKKQMLSCMMEIAADPIAECERVAQQIYDLEYARCLTDLAKVKARTVCNITGYDPYPNQPGGPEFAEAVSQAKQDTEIMKEATQKASTAKDTWKASNSDDLTLKSLVELMVRVRRRFKDMDMAMQVLYAQCQEITHVSLALVKFNGVSCNYGSKGIKMSSECDGHCPSIYHQSRDPAYALAMELLENGILSSELGVDGSSTFLFIPGMPPFYFGDVTKGHDYAEGCSDKGIYMNQGNQLNDGGLHGSLYNRRDGAGLAVSDDAYLSPVQEIVKEMVSCMKEGKNYKLCDGTELPPVVKFTCNTRYLKMIQGQKRNDHLCGGDRYLGLALPDEMNMLMKKLQKTIMPPSFTVDASFAPHLSIAMLGPAWVQHFKSRPRMQMAKFFMKNGYIGSDGTPICNGDITDFHKDFVATTGAYRSAWTPDATLWNVYEEAATKMPSCKFNHLHIETLGFKTAIMSKALCDTDHISDTIYNGTGASKELRAMKMDTTIIRYGAGGIRSFNVGGTSVEAFENYMTAATYKNLRMTNESQDVLVENEQKKMKRWHPTMEEMAKTAMATEDKDVASMDMMDES